MISARSPRESAKRVYHRAKLLRHFETESLTRAITLGPAGCVRVSRCAWEAHWQILSRTANCKLTALLAAFETSWRAYIRSGFCSALVRDYCFRYHALLEALLRQYLAEPTRAHTPAPIQEALSFECLPIMGGTQPEEMVAAGTTSLRNPCYLLARLANPAAMDNCQFLPAITAGMAKRTRLFRNYRRHKLSADTDISVLLYEGTDPMKTFPVLNTLQRQFAQRDDPWAHERSQRLAKQVLLPYVLETIRTQGSAQDQRLVQVELLDIGGGSGTLVSGICHQLGEGIRRAGKTPSFRLWMADVSPGDPARFFRTASRRHLVDSVMCSSYAVANSTAADLACLQGELLW